LYGTSQRSNSPCAITRFWNNLHQERKPCRHLKCLGSKKTKGSKYDSQNRLRTHMPEGGESQFL
jgi:hypothetical protein